MPPIPYWINLAIKILKCKQKLLFTYGPDGTFNGEVSEKSESDELKNSSESNLKHLWRSFKIKSSAPTRLHQFRNTCTLLLFEVWLHFPSELVVICVSNSKSHYTSGLIRDVVYFSCFTLAYFSYETLPRYIRRIRHSVPVLPWHTNSTRVLVSSKKNNLVPRAFLKVLEVGENDPGISWSHDTQISGCFIMYLFCSLCLWE